MQLIYPVDEESNWVLISDAFGNGKTNPEAQNQQQDKMSLLCSMTQHHFHRQRCSCTLTYIYDMKNWEFKAKIFCNDFGLI